MRIGTTPSKTLFKWWFPFSGNPLLVHSQQGSFPDHPLWFPLIPFRFILFSHSTYRLVKPSSTGGFLFHGIPFQFRPKRGHSLTIPCGVLYPAGSFSTGVIPYRLIKPSSTGGFLFHGIAFRFIPNRGHSLTIPCGFLCGNPLPVHSQQGSFPIAL